MEDATTYNHKKQTLEKLLCLISVKNISEQYIELFAVPTIRALDKTAVNWAVELPMIMSDEMQMIVLFKYVEINS